MSAAPAHSITSSPPRPARLACQSTSSSVVAATCASADRALGRAGWARCEPEGGGGEARGAGNAHVAGRPGEG